MLERSKTVLVLVDVQEKLAQVMHERDLLTEQLVKLTQGAQALGVPVIRLEQLPDKLGPTIPELAELLADVDPIAKSCFSCCGSDEFLAALNKTGATQVIVAGIETHVCIVQTALDLAEPGVDVHVVADAVSSRTAENKQIALDRIRDAGCTVTSVEMVLFELLGDAGSDAFRSLLKIVK